MILHEASIKMSHHKHNRIFIVGLSGAGKGVLAEAIAKRLGWKFINADILGAAAHVGRTVSEIVGEEGELRFNQCLTEILACQMSQDNIVVTTLIFVCDKKEFFYDTSFDKCIPPG